MCTLPSLPMFSPIPLGFCLASPGPRDPRPPRPTSDKLPSLSRTPPEFSLSSWSVLPMPPFQTVSSLRNCHSPLLPQANLLLDALPPLPPSAHQISPQPHSSQNWGCRSIYADQRMAPGIGRVNKIGLNVAKNHAVPFLTFVDAAQFKGSKDRTARTRRPRGKTTTPRYFSQKVSLLTACDCLVAKLRPASLKSK